MKKLFVQFYLLLFVCFLVMTMMVGLVYKFTAERAGRQSLDDLMKSSLYLMRSELREISTPLSSASRAATTYFPSARCPISIFCTRCACSIWP